MAVFRSAYQAGFWQRFTSDLQHLRLTVDRMQYVLPVPGPDTLNLGGAYTLRQVVLDLARIPGRKGLVHFGRMPGLADDVADLANRSSVTIYTIDMGGLPPEDRYSVSRGRLERGPAKTTASAIFMSQGGSSSLAAQTGGLFFDNSNDLGALLSRAVTDFGGGYYLLGWYPGEDAFKRKNERLQNHKIKVRVRRKGLSVRSRSGFVGRPGPEPPRQPASPSARMQDAIWSPFHSGDLDVGLTTRWGRDDRTGPYMEGLVHVVPEGIEFYGELGGCRMATLEFLFALVPLTTPLTNDSETQSTHLSSYVSTLSVCGETAQRLTENGLVWRVREKTWKPGPYDVRIAVRNAQPLDPHSLSREATAEVAPAPIKVGSASQYLEIPNLVVSKLAVAGLTLGGMALKETADSLMQGVTARVATDADPGVRRFRAGDEIDFDWRVLNAPAGDGSRIEAHVSVIHDGKEVFSGPPAKLTFVTDEAQVKGVYGIESLEPGRYWLGATAAEKAEKGKTTRTATEWLHFDVIP